MDNTEKLNALVGKTLDNRYKILEVVGVGGMAVVLKAEDTVMNRVVAIKVLNDEYNGDENAIRRFINESKAVAMLSHPNIVNIFDVAFGSNMKYIVMEYIDGITLNEYMQKKGKLTWKDAVHFADQILLALEHAHEKGIVHRDVKPQNIMLLKSGTVKVADFGIAKLPNIEPSKSVQEKAIGTVYYMSPEQACGQATDTATDIYSLGVMLYEMTTGQLPFDGETTTEIASKQVNELPAEPRSIEITIPRGLEQIILKAMEKDPKNRYDSAHTMRRMLQILRNNPSIVFADGNNRSSTASSYASDIASGHDTGTRQFDVVTPGDKIPISNIPVNANEKPVNQDKTIQQSPIVKQKKQASGGVNKSAHTSSQIKAVPKKRAEKSFKGKNTMFPIIFGVALAFLAVLAASGAVLLSSIFENSIGVGTVYEIPSYIGMEYNQELRDKIVADDLILRNVKYEYNLDSDKDYVVSQEPVPDSKRKTQDIVLVVSLGSQTIVMQDFTMCMYTKAEVYLNNMGLDPVIRRVYDPSVMENYIIRTEPAEGETLKVGDKVTLYVSSGDDTEFVPMPGLVGKTEEEAKRILTENSITKVKVITQGSARPTGEVLEQDVAEGVNIPKDTAEITLTVSEYDSALDPNVPPADLPVSGKVDLPADGTSADGKVSADGEASVENTTTSDVIDEQQQPEEENTQTPENQTANQVDADVQQSASELSPEQNTADGE